MIQGFGIVSQDDGSHAYLSTSWVVVCGVYMFFFVDKLLKLIMTFRKVCHCTLCHTSKNFIYLRNYYTI